MPEIYQLRCRECGKPWGNAPRSFCEECFSPLEVAYDYQALKSIAAKEKLSKRDFNMPGMTLRVAIDATPRIPHLTLRLITPRFRSG